jgi:putative ABC transport system permease protein
MILSIIIYQLLLPVLSRAKEVGVQKYWVQAKGISHFNLSQTVVIVLLSILFALVIVEISLPYYNELWI